MGMCTSTIGNTRTWSFAFSQSFSLLPKYLPSNVDRCGARGHSRVVHHLVGQCNRGAIGKGSWPVPSLQEKGQKFPFAFHKDGTSPHKAEAILSKDDLRLFYHLHMENRDKVREEEAKMMRQKGFWTAPVVVVVVVCRYSVDLPPSPRGENHRQPLMQQTTIS